MDLQSTLSKIDSLNSNDSLFIDTCKDLSKAICNNEVKLHDIVTQLEYLLVNISSDKRAIGTYILSTILENVEKDFLNSAELQFLSNFYADRLKDHHQVIPAVLKGILSMTYMKHLTLDCLPIMLRALFDNVPCQQQQKSDRQCIYNILKQYSITHQNDLSSMGLDFVLGIISSIDGERDPHNLLILFEWLTTLLPHLKMGHLAEEMFDIISCYFPVDFRAAPQDSELVITRELLATKLNSCLCVVPEFAEFCLPLLLEKLSSALKIAKLDSLNLLVESCKTFDTSMYETHSDEIFISLQKELINVTDMEIRDAGLNALSSVINKLSTSQNKRLFKQTCLNIYETLKGNLRPDTKLFISTSQILLAIAKGSQETCSLVFDLVVPTLLNFYSIETNTQNQEVTLKTLMSFTLLYINTYNIKDISDNNLLKEITVLCLQTVQNKEVRLRIIGWQNIALFSKCLPINERDILYQILAHKIVENEPIETRKEILNCFKTVALQYNDEIYSKILNNQVDFNNPFGLKLYLEAICIIIPCKEFTTNLLPQLLKYCINENILHSSIAFKCLNNMLKLNYSNDLLQNTLHKQYEIIKQILTWVLTSNSNLNNDLLNDVANILKLIIGYQKTNEQKVIVLTYLTELVKHLELNGRNDSILVILEGFLCRLRQDVEIPDKFNMVKSILFNSVTKERYFYECVCQMVANVINKCQEDATDILMDFEVHISTVIKTNNADQISNVIQLHSWITKALLLKGAPQTDHWIDELINLLGCYSETAKCFKLIMDDNYECLSKESFANIRMLYRQRFFAYVINKLNGNFNKEKINHLAATGYLLQLTPQSIVKRHLKEVFKLVIFCLQFSEDVDALCAVLGTLEILLREKELSLESHVDDLIPYFIKLCTFRSSMRVRMGALKCLEALPGSYPTHRLLPHKRPIIFDLLPCLDDPKRLVRKQAVSARSAWFMLDAPT